jgi:hypothetical protein
LNRIRRLWRGELPLIQAFWDWAAIGGIVVNGATSILFFTLLMNDRPLTALILGYAISVPYNLLVTVGVWRSADRHPGNPTHAKLAKIVTTASMAILSIT